MKVLLGSGGFGTEERRASFREATRTHLEGVERVLFVPHALADHAGYLEFMRERDFAAGLPLDGLHEQQDPCAAVAAAQAIYVGGGNTFRLLTELQQGGLLGLIRERVRAGAPYIGVSAGSNIACPTMMTTNDMPIVQPPSLESLGLVPFQLNAHYFSGSVHVSGPEGELVEHFGETRDERIAEYHELNDQPVVGLREGSWLRCEPEVVELEGASARIFRVGVEPLDVEPPSELAELVGAPTP